MVSTLFPLYFEGFSETVIFFQLSNWWCYCLSSTLRAYREYHIRSETDGVLAYHEQLLFHATAPIAL